LKNICRNFLGNEKVENYSETAQQLTASYSAVGCNMSLTLHFLHSHVGFFPENMAAVSNENCRRFHQDISQTKKRYCGKWSPNMLAEYRWSLTREMPTGENKRQQNTKTLFLETNILLLYYKCRF